MSAYWIVDQLIHQGIELFCLSPGSRSTPLALAVAEHPKARSIVHFDERGVGFYAMGYAKGAKRPAALIVTSGTAVGNLLPSLLEAHHSCLPMIVLTSDRPPELRDCSANQTTDQIKIFGQSVRWQVDLPVTGSESFFRSTIAQAVFFAMQNPPGPVQVNCAFREPFYPAETPPSTLNFPIRHTLPRLFPPIEDLKSNASQGLILIGQIPEDPAPILQLAQKLQWPVFADLLSNARCQMSSEQIRDFDAILKRENCLEPDQILHFGERFISKKLLSWAKNVPYTHISPYPKLQDPERRIRHRVQSDIEWFCLNFQAPQALPDWLSYWKSLEKPLPPHPISVPQGWAVFLGNSMPIRNADHFLYPENCAGFFCNRGLSGIDGNIATAAGLSDGLQKPLVVWIGDQACLHDLNSLPLLKQSPFPIRLIVENNQGGRIFHHFPISTSKHCEKFWIASHEWQFEGAARMFDLPYMQTETLGEDLPTTSCFIEWVPSAAHAHCGL